MIETIITKTGEISADKVSIDGVNVPKNNYSATTAPTSLNDSTSGYSEGSIWVDTISKESYTCVNPTVGAAVWISSSKNQQKFNGLEPKSAFTLSYDAVGRTLTVTCSSDAVAWVGGKDFKCTTETTTAHADVTGTYYFYYNTSGILSISTTPWTLGSTAPLALVYYNATTKKGILYDERHPGFSGMPDATHANLHLTRGTQILSGFSISSYTLNASGYENLSYQVESGVLADEDLYTTLPTLNNNGPYRVFWRTGSSVEWAWSDTSVTGILDNGTNIYFNEFTGSVWQLSPITTNDTFVNYYVFAMPTISGYPGIVVIMGQSTYSSLSEAQAEDPSSSLAGFTELTVEGVFVSRMTYKRISGAYPSNAVLTSVQSIRTNIINITSGFTPSDHQALSNRSSLNAHPAGSISVVTSSFTKNLNASDDTVQKSLNKLDLIPSVDWEINGVEQIDDSRIKSSSITQHEEDIDHSQLFNTHNLTSDIDHNSLSGYVLNEHINHSTIIISSELNGGLSGSGDLTGNISFKVDIENSSEKTTIDNDDKVLIHDSISDSLKSVKKNLISPKSNYLATSAPALTNDSSEGYSEGSTWVDTVSKKAYICVGSTQGSAVWNLATVDTSSDSIPSKSSSLVGEISSSLDSHSVTYTSNFLNSIRKIKTEIFFYSTEVECVWEKISHIGKDNTLKLTQDSFTSKLYSDVECSIQYSSETLSVNFINISTLTSKKYKILVSELSTGI